MRNTAVSKLILSYPQNCCLLAICLYCLLFHVKRFFSVKRFSVVQSCRIFPKNSEVVFEPTVEPRPEVLNNETGFHYGL